MEVKNNCKENIAKTVSFVLGEKDGNISTLFF